MRDLLFGLLTHFLYQFLQNKSIPGSFVEKVYKILDSIEKVSENLEMDEEAEEDDSYFYSLPSAKSMRIYSAQECVKLDNHCRSFLLRLEQIGLLSPEDRENIIHQVMISELNQVELETLKETVLTILTENSDLEQHLWLQDLVLTGDHKKWSH